TLERRMAKCERCSQKIDIAFRAPLPFNERPGCRWCGKTGADHPSLDKSEQVTNAPNSTVPNAAHGTAQRRRYIVRQAKNDRHNWQFIRKLAADHINSNPYRYALTRDGRLVESKLPAAVQADLRSQLQRKLLQIPLDEP